VPVIDEQVQTVTLSADSALTAGTLFSLSYEGLSTPATLNMLSTAYDVHTALGNLASVTTVAVTRNVLVSGDTGALGVTWVITFTHLEEKVGVGWRFSLYAIRHLRAWAPVP
jgi:hypothetical protein